MVSSVKCLSNSEYKKVPSKIGRYVAKKTNDWVHVRVESAIIFTAVHTFNEINPSAIACDIPTPSLGEVPRPSSSTRTSDFGVANPMQPNQRRSYIYPSAYPKSLQTTPSRSRMCSGFSPYRRRSKAASEAHRVPYVVDCISVCLCSRQKAHLKLAYSAGTKQPHRAITESRPTWRR